jgi:hypothetical protein
MLAEYPKTRKPLRSHKARSLSPHPITSPSLLPVEVVIPKVDANGAEVGGEFITATELKVAKWENSFTASVDPVLKDDFIAWDRDRFYIKIPNANGLKIDSIELATEDNPDATYNDDSTEIELTDIGNGEYLTDSIILVSDDVDDNYPGSGAGEDDKKNDRTHKVQLGGNVVIKSITINDVKHELNYKIPVKAQKQLDIDFHRMKIDEMYTVAQIESAIKVVKERYAQVGLKINATLHEKDWPDISDEAEGRFKLFTSGWHSPLHQEYKDFVDSIDSKGVNVFFVDAIYPSNGLALNLRRLKYDNPLSLDYMNNVFIRLKYDNPLSLDYMNNVFINRRFLGASFHLGYSATLSHELLHLIGPEGFDDDDHVQFRRNILYQKPLYDSVLSRKRINHKQQLKIYQHLEVKEIAP